MTRGHPQIGDVVLTTEAPLGEVAQINFLPVTQAQRIVTLRGKKDILDNRYLLYLRIYFCLGLLLASYPLGNFLRLLLWDI